MMKFFLFTRVEDYEGNFGDLQEFNTSEEAVAASLVFQTNQKKQTEHAWEWAIIEGVKTEWRESHPEQEEVKS